MKIIKIINSTRSIRMLKDFNPFKIKDRHLVFFHQCFQRRHNGKNFKSMDLLERNKVLGDLQDYTLLKS